MLRSTPVLLLMLCVLALPYVSKASEPFTPAQYALIKKMLGEQREQILNEISAGAAVCNKEPSSTTPIDIGDGTPGPSRVDVSPAVLGPEIDVVPLDRGMNAGLSGLELEANSDAGEVRAALAKTWSLGEDTKRAGEVGLALKASTPMDDKPNKRGHFSTLDSLTGGTSLALSVSHSSTRRILIDDNGVPSEEWSRLCKLAGHPSEDRCTLGIIYKAMQSGEAKELRSAYAAFARSQYGWGRVVEGRLGAAKKDYEFLGSDLTKLEDSRNAWSIGGSVGFSSPDRRALYAFGVDLQRDYKANSPELVHCPALTTSPLVCVPGRLGPPERIYQRLVWLETRSSISRFPFAVRVTQELEGSVTGVDLPIYLFRAEGKPFSGGLRLGWNSEDGVDGGIFISSYFDTFR